MGALTRGKLFLGLEMPRGENFSETLFMQKSGLDGPVEVLRHQIIDVSFDQTRNLEQKLSSLKWLEKVVQFGDKFRLHVRSTSEAVPLLGDFARENDLKIVSINSLNPSLEDVFVEMTGLSPEIMANEKEKGKKVANVG